MVSHERRRTRIFLQGVVLAIVTVHRRVMSIIEGNGDKTLVPRGNSGYFKREAECGASRDTKRASARRGRTHWTRSSAAFASFCSCSRGHLNSSSSPREQKSASLETFVLHLASCCMCLSELKETILFQDLLSRALSG